MSFEADASTPTVSEIFSAGLWETPPQLTQVADRRKLFAFAMLWDLTLDVFEIAGGFVAACNFGFAEATSSARTTCSGNGFTIAQAVLGCLGEVVEVASWLYRPADRENMRDALGVERPGALSAEAVLGFSPAQVRHRDRLNKAWDGYDAVPPPAQLRTPQLWSKVSSYDGESESWCPAFLVFGRFGEIEAGDTMLNVDSNGCAAGVTIEAARERAVLELIERDATGIWWWRGCYRARISAARFAGTALGSALAEHRAFSGRRMWFVDISVWDSATVVAALSCDGSGRRVAAGFAAAFDVYDAAAKAFRELIQGELAIDAHEIRIVAGTPTSGADRRLARWLETLDLDDLTFAFGTGDVDGTVTAKAGHRRQSGSVPSGTEGHQTVHANPHGRLEDLLTELANSGHRIWFADLERPEIGIPATKALCEGLAHFKPRFGCRRLWTVPKAQGWLTMFGEAASERPPPLII